MKTKEKLDLLYQFFVENPNFSITTCYECFPDGTKILGFWNYCQIKASNYSQKEALTNQELYLVQTLAIIDHLRKEYNLSKEAKIKKILSLTIEDPKISLFTTPAVFSDQTTISSFWRYIQKIIRECRTKESLTDEEYVLLSIAAKIDEIRQDTSEKPSHPSISLIDEKMQEVYQKVLKDPMLSLSRCEDQLIDGTRVKEFYTWIKYIVKKCSRKSPLTEEEQIVLYYAAKMDESRHQTKTKVSTLEKAKILLEYSKSHPQCDLYHSLETFPDGSLYSSCYMNLYRHEKLNPTSEKKKQKEEEIVKLFREIRTLQKKYN